MMMPVMLSQIVRVGLVAFFLTVAGSEAGSSLPATPFEGQAAPESQNQVDEFVFNRLEALGIQPANACSDAVFVRRVFLDVIGTLPTPEETVAFLKDKNPRKRQVLIDKLLERDEFADYWAMKWSDLLRVKAEFPINLWPNAVQAYHRWIRTCLKENMPYDQFVRAMLTASGSNFRAPPVNFYRALQNKDAQGIAQTVALTFMGARSEYWPSNRLTCMSAFFSQIGYKSTAEWKEEIVYFDPGKTNLPAEVIFPDGTPAKLGGDVDPREVFSDWLIDPKNPWFTRNIANRVWAWLMGRGIVHETDDFRSDNPPVNPELLAFLQQELIKSHYDLKALYRLILNSQTYQLSSIAKTTKPAGPANFAQYPLRRLEAEVLIDALNQITGATERYTSPIPEPFTFIPEDQRSISLADGSTTSSFLEMFGRPARDTGMENERNNRPTPSQRLHLLNSSHIQNKLEQSKNLQSIWAKNKTPRDIASGLYLLILSRYPTDEEVVVVSDYFKTAVNKREACVDLAWALINSAEFLYRH